MSILTARSDAIRHIVTTCADAIGEEPASFAQRAGVAWKNLVELDRAPVSVLHRAWSLASSQRSAWPVLVAQSLSLESLGPYGFAVLTASSGADSLATAVRAYPIISEAARWTLSLEGQHAIVRYVGAAPSSAGERSSIEAMAAHVCVGLRRVSSATATRVRFGHARPRYAYDLAARLDCALDWDQSRTEIVVARDTLDARPPLANAAMSELLAAHLQRELSSLVAPRSFSDRVSGVIEASLERAWSCAEVAAKLRTSERTLRRRLADEGTSLRALRDALRETRARELLADGDRSVGDVARAVGFADSSAFSRAFRRRTGAAPRRR